MRGIFRPVERGGDFHRNAVVEHYDDDVLAIGFAEAADVAVEHWKEYGPNDLLFIPILFLHRHAFELILKAALVDAAACLRAEGQSDAALDQAALDQWLGDPKSGGHRLEALAGRLDTWLSRLGLDLLPGAVRGAITALHQLDPKGDSFRYAAVKRKGGLERAPRPGLLKPGARQSHVDVVAMHDQLKAAFGLLAFGLLTELENFREYQREMSYYADG